MNSADKARLGQFTKELSILHYAMTFGAFMISVVIYFFMITDGHFNFSDTSDFFLFLCPLFAIGGVFIGGFLYKKKIQEISGLNTLEEKLGNYRAASVMKFALLEGPALICILASMETQNLLYLVIGIILIIYLFMQHKSEHQIVEDLGLD